MRVTVIPTDKVIVVDGNGITLDEWNFSDDHIHAIQWVHDSGHIELKTNDPNIPINDFSEIQKYVDAYMNIIPTIEEKILKEQEEKRLIAEKEEQEKLAYEKELKEKEKQVQDLIEQNKKIREDKMKLEEDHSNTLIQKNLIEERNRLELDKINFEKQAELQELKHGETLKEIMKRDSELMQRYEGLMSQLDEQRDVIKKEQESHSEIIALKEEQIEAERKELEKRAILFTEKMNLERSKLDLERQKIEEDKLNYENQLDYSRDMVNVLNKTIEFDNLRLQKEKEIQQEYIEQHYKTLNIKSEEYDLMNERLLQSLKELKERKDVLEVEIHASKKGLDEEIEQSEKLLSAARELELEYINSLEQNKLSSKNELESSFDYENVSVEELEKIISELNPEQVYTSLTSGEINENNFPVEKAIIWFSALKKVMDERD